MIELVTRDNGVALREDVFLELRKTGDGPALLLLAGVEGIHADAAFIDELAKHYTVYAPSHPGFGASARPQWCDSVEDLAYLYLDWLEALNETDVVLVGLQFGGWIAAEMAVRDSRRISALVLVDSVGIKVGGYEDRDIQDVFALNHDDLEERYYAKSGNRLGPLSDARETEVLRLARNSEALALYGWEPYLHNTRLARWLRRIDVPSYVAWGEQDGIVSTDYGAALAALVPGSRFETIADAGHRAQIDQPALLADRVHEFVTKATSGSN